MSVLPVGVIVSEDTVRGVVVQTGLQAQLLDINALVLEPFLHGLNRALLVLELYLEVGGVALSHD